MTVEDVVKLLAALAALGAPVIVIGRLALRTISRLVDRILEQSESQNKALKELIEELRTDRKADEERRKELAFERREYLDKFAKESGNTAAALSGVTTRLNAVIDAMLQDTEQRSTSLKEMERRVGEQGRETLKTIDDLLKQMNTAVQNVDGNARSVNDAQNELRRIADEARSSFQNLMKEIAAENTARNTMLTTIQEVRSELATTVGNLKIDVSALRENQNKIEGMLLVKSSAEKASAEQP